MARLITAQPKFKILVANIEGAGDPSRGMNPVKVRTGFVQQLIPEVPRGPTVTEAEDYKSPGTHTHQGLLDYTTPPVPVGCTGTVTVVDNDFAAPATLYVGEFTLTSGEDYTVGGTTDLTAAALASAINALPGFSALAALSVVTVTGPFGPNGNTTLFDDVYTAAIQNFTLSPATGFFSGGEPTIGPPEILS
jgi:hypothetical protein